MSIVGEYANEFLNEFRADLAFISTKSLSLNGLFEGDDSQALCKRHMITNAKRVILLCDTSKEFASAYFRLCSYSDIDFLISNGPLSEELTNILEENSCRLIYPR